MLWRRALLLVFAVMARTVQQHLLATRAYLWRTRDRLRHWARGRAYVAEAFDRIYRENLWGDPESVSGGGSSTAATERVRTALPPLLRRLQVETLLDAPCGDFHWMQEIASHVRQYIGVDIVSSLIEHNKSAYETERIQFRVANIAEDPLPKADLILCRDCFIHLPERMIRAALRNFLRSGARYVLLTNEAGAGPYRDIAIGSFRSLDLRAAPFVFPAPLEIIQEDETTGRQLCLWELRALPITE